MERAVTQNNAREGLIANNIILLTFLKKFQNNPILGIITIGFSRPLLPTFDGEKSRTQDCCRRRRFVSFQSYIHFKNCLLLRNRDVVTIP